MAVNFCWKEAMLPYVFVRAAVRVGAVVGEVEGEEGGVRIDQKMEWLMWPPAWNFMVCWRATWPVMSPDAWRVAWVARAALRLLTYVWWCLVWWSVMISLEMCGSSA